jgi:uncharacterized membrane protein
MSDWYYAANNEQKGPINESELKANLAANKLPVDTLVWKDGMDNWTPANQVAAFTFRQPPTPAKVQPPIGAAPTLAATPAAASPSVGNPDSTKPVGVADVIGEPESLEVSADDVEKHKVFGILAYLGPLCLLQLVAAKDSPFAKYHANQGLVLFIVEIAAFFITFAGILIPFIGIIFYLIHVILYLAFLVLIVLGIINAAAGKCVPLPVIGGVKLLK